MHILPPHILRAIVERGTELQREAAARTLALDATFRSLRVGPPLRRPTTPGTAAHVRRRTIYSAGHRQDLAGSRRRDRTGPACAVT